jgi:hypothetical protein
MSYSNKIFYIRQRFISHIRGKNTTPESCGYYKKIILWEDDFEKCEQNLKEKLNVDEISTINGINLIHLQQPVNINKLLFFNNPLNRCFKYEYPPIYEIDFENYLDKFLERFKEILKKKFKFNNSSFNKSHSDKIDPFREIFIEAYSQCIEEYPKIENKKMREFEFFNNTFYVMDKIIRYLKSYILSSNEKKRNEDLINNLFLNESGSRWFLNRKLNMKYPIESKIYEIYEKYEKYDIIIESPLKKEYSLFLTTESKKQNIETKMINKDISIKDFIPSWETIYEKIKSYKNPIVVYLPSFRNYYLDYTNFEEDKNMIQFQYHINKFELNNFDIFKYFKNERLLSINRVDNKIKEIKNVKFERIKKNILIFFKLL